LRQADSGIKTVYITEPTWSNHDLLFSRLGFEVKKLPYYINGSFNSTGFISALEEGDSTCAVVLHACAHNPTGYDPTHDQWKNIASVIKKNDILPIFDSAYLGFNSGFVDEDAWAIRYFTEELALEVCICLSFAKNMGLYGERVGLTAFVTSSSDEATIMSSILSNVQRATVSNPPAYGAKLAATVLGTPVIKKQWFDDLVTMSSRIKSVRQMLYEALVSLGTPGEWSHIIKQTGMFGYTGISEAQVAYLEGN
jgi:aspartate aminotransferase